MRYLYLLVLLTTYAAVSAQTDTTMSHINIEPVTVTALPHANHDQLYTQNINDEQQLIDELLESKSTVYIKSYGGGSLATLSLRGGSASQTQLQWEGIPLNNPMLGISDLSLVPINLFSQFSLSKGGLSALNGSGAMTGILNMDNRISSNRLEAMAQLEAGSFGELGSQLKVSGSRKKLSGSIQTFIKESNNDFPYQLTGGLENTNTNARFESNGVMTNLQFNPSDLQMITFSSWHQNTHREIPPTTVQNSSIAFQDDILSRYKLTYKGYFENIDLQSQFAYFDEQNNFTDPDRLTEAKNRFKTFFNAGSIGVSSKYNANLRYEYSQTTGISNSYADEGNVFRKFALVASSNIDYKRLKLHGILRKEWNNIVNAPLIPSLTLSYWKNKFLTSFKFSREFRSPTLNELYWLPVGNLNLQPELGWNQELGFTVKGQKSISSFNITAYHRKINNWILWVPLNGPNDIWGPTNLTNVRSYGIDLDGQKEFKTEKASYTVGSGYAYTRSINLTAVNQHDIKEGDQLFYTPMHKAFINIGLEYNKISVDYAQSYTSEVTAINENLSGYSIGQASLHYAFATRKIKHNIHFNIHNLFNSSYRIIERRPMPGRHFNIGWTIKFIKKDET